MQGKHIHIVFQILNFLHSPLSKQFNLLPVDKLILINLASHKGSKGIFPTQETIANELNLSLRYTRTRLSYLVKTGLLIVQPWGKNNTYKLEKLSTIEDPQILCDDSADPSSKDLQILYQGIPESSHRGSVDPPNNKRSNKNNKKERERTVRALPLPVNFTVSNEGQNLCKERNLDVAIMEKKFILISQASGKCYVDPDAGFQLFVMNEKAGGSDTKKSNVVNLRAVPVPDDDEEQKPCGGCKRPVRYCTCRRSSSATASDFIRQIREKCKI